MCTELDHDWTPEDDFLLLSALRASMSAAEIVSFVPFMIPHSESAIRARRELFKSPALQESIDQIPVTRKKQLWDAFQASCKYWKSKPSIDNMRTASFSLPPGSMLESNSTMAQVVRPSRRHIDHPMYHMNIPQQQEDSSIPMASIQHMSRRPASAIPANFPPLPHPSSFAPQQQQQQQAAPSTQKKKERFHPFQKDPINQGARRPDVGYAAILKQVSKRKSSSHEPDYFPELGKLDKIEYKMEKMIILIGWSEGEAEEESENRIDLDLSKVCMLRGDCDSVQACIKLERDGEFYLRNVSNKHPIYADGVKILPLQTKKLKQHSHFVIGGAAFRFEINSFLQSILQSEIQAEMQKK